MRNSTRHEPAAMHRCLVTLHYAEEISASRYGLSLGVCNRDYHSIYIAAESPNTHLKR